MTPTTLLLIAALLAAWFAFSGLVGLAVCRMSSRFGARLELIEIERQEAARPRRGSAPVRLTHR
jgi:hypothetical protein